MTVDVDQLLEQLADRVAARLAPLLASSPAAEPWRLLDVEQAAARLGRSTRWVRERAKRGDLAYVRLDGGGLAFEEGDLQAFARARRVSVDEPGPLAGRLQEGRDPASRNGSDDPDAVGTGRFDGDRVPVEATSSASRGVPGAAVCSARSKRRRGTDPRRGGRVFIPLSDSSATPNGKGARGYSWPPFQPGHALSRRHGLYSRFVMLEDEEEIADTAAHLRALLPTYAPAFEPALQLLAARLWRLKLGYAYVQETPTDGVSAKFLESLNATENVVSRALARLGLDPVSCAELGVNLQRLAAAGEDGGRPFAWGNLEAGERVELDRLIRKGRQVDGD